MSNWREKANSGGGNYGPPVPLPAGVYGKKVDAKWYEKQKKPIPTQHEGLLRIQKYLGTRQKEGSANIQHSFIVVSTNGTDGTAFLKFNLQPWMLTPEAVALAFGKDAEVGYVEEGGKPEDLTGTAEAIRKNIRTQLAEANTPEEAVETELAEQYKKTLDSIRINVGQIYRLQDAQGAKRDETADLSTLVGTEFPGAIEQREFGGNTNAEVKSIYAAAAR